MGTEPQPQSYSKKQLETFAVLRRDYHCTVVLYFLLGAFAFVLVMIGYSVFSLKGDPWALYPLIGVDGVIGWGIKRIITYLFPDLNLPKDKKSIGPGSNTT